ncbi:MAG: hypothetical protein J5949_02510 [Oscillospiraceae bacterium]|nr:hypothetical protein [Oscillospiraceae bacterium]
MTRLAWSRIVSILGITIFLLLTVWSFTGKTDPQEAAKLYDFTEIYAGGGSFISLDNDYIFLDYKHQVMVEVITRNDERAYTYVLVDVSGDGKIHGIQSDGSLSDGYYQVVEEDGAEKFAFFNEDGTRSKQKALKKKDMTKSMKLLVESGFLRAYPDPAMLYEAAKMPMPGAESPAPAESTVPEEELASAAGDTAVQQETQTSEVSPVPEQTAAPEEAA